MTDRSLRWPAGPGRPRTAPGCVDVWAARFDDDTHDPGALSALFTPDEEERARRFVRDEDERRWRISRGILRVLLGRYLEADPAALRFHYGAEGKPALEGASGLRFNLSHARDIVLYAVTTEGEVGVDVEGRRPLPDLHAVARKVFSPAELGALDAVEPASVLDAFYRGWTRKEAILKALGLGFSGDTRAFDVTLAPGDPPRVLGARGEMGDAGSWSLCHLEPAADALGAVAMARPGLEVRNRHIPGWWGVAI